MYQTIKIISVEDSPQMRNRLVEMFSRDERFELAALFPDAETLLGEIPALTADIALIDLELPGIKGEELIPILRARFPKMKIAVLTAFEEQTRLLRLLKCGIKGYLLKDSTDELLLAELHVLHLGGAPLTEKVARKILEDLPERMAFTNQSGNNHLAEAALSEREQQVLNMIALGLKYREIAEELNVSPHTVRRHIESIYKKLEIHSRADAVHVAKKIGMIP